METLQALTEAPELVFALCKGGDAVAHVNNVTKEFLDPYAKQYSVLDELYTEGLDALQVFGQAKMVLSGLSEKLLFDKIPKFRGAGDGARQQDELEVGDDKDSDDEVEESEDQESGTDSDDEAGNDIDKPNEEEAHPDAGGSLDTSEEFYSLDGSEEETFKKDAHGLNDEFFDIDEFNKQIVALDDPDDDDGIDYFADLSDDEAEEMDYYDGFFDKPGKKETPKKSKGEDEWSDDEYDNAVNSAMLDLFADEDEPEKEQTLSSFEKQQQQIQNEISKLEAELVADKKWTMKGEVRSLDRPADSLLADEAAGSMQFDRTAKPVPVITEEVTETLEELIKRRIRDGVFDDVPKRLVTDVSRFQKQQKAEVSQEKSAKLLAELYEDEYTGQTAEKELTEEVRKAHDEILELFGKLNYKLDLLCLAHYIPKPHQFRTVEVVAGAAASVSMEDAQPMHVSDEMKLAPQEVYKIGDDKPAADGAKGRREVQLKSGLAIAKDELLHEDKQRVRRAKKRAKLAHFNEVKAQREAREREKGPESDRKRPRVSEALETLQNAKNVSIIDKKGELRDVKGALKKKTGASSANAFRL